MIDKNAPIGVFDSGVGGLTVFKEIMNQLPKEKVIYFGDTARVPYGTKSKETIIRYSEQIIRFLREQGVKYIVVACGTASAQALSVIENETEIPIMGVVKPGAITACNVTKNNKVGVIATRGSINSHVYEKCIHDINPHIEVSGRACPLFVPLVEEGLREDPVTEEIARRYLMELKDSGIDTLILGCTHFPLIRKTIGAVMGEEVNLVNMSYETAKELKEALEEKDLLRTQAPKLGEEQYQFYVSDDPEEFKKFANSIIKYGILSAKKINIENY